MVETDFAGLGLLTLAVLLSQEAKADMVGVWAKQRGWGVQGRLKDLVTDIRPKEEAAPHLGACGRMRIISYAWLASGPLPFGGQ